MFYAISFDENDDFKTATFDAGNGYDTNIRNRLVFIFGDFRINLYSLYNLFPFLRYL